MTRVQMIEHAQERVDTARAALTRLDVTDPRFQSAVDDFTAAIRTRQAAERDTLPRTKLSRERRDAKP